MLQDVTLGFAFGIGMGYLASWLMPRGAEDIPAHHKSLYALGVAFATYGVAVLEPVHGNGFIAVFVCAIVLGIRRPDLGRHFEERADDIVEIVKLGIFVVFGALLTFGGLFEDGWAAVAHRRLHAAVRAARSRSGSRSPARGSTPPPRPSWPGSAPRAWRR